MAENRRHQGLTSPRYWDEHRGPGPLKLSPDSHLEPYLLGVLPKNDAWTCLEIGVVPGNMLLWFSRTFGYRPRGIDFSSITPELKGLFADLGCDAEFYQEDFLQWDPGETFDVVYSCGFLEHFDDYRTIIARHWDLVRTGGYLVLTCPAMTPVQLGIRKILYTRDHFEKMMKAHNREAMKLAPLKEAVQALPGSTVVSARYIREMKVWIRKGQPGVRENASPLFPVIHFFEAILGRLGISSPLFSPQILVVAKKTMPHGNPE